MWRRCGFHYLEQRLIGIYKCCYDKFCNVTHINFIFRPTTCYYIGVLYSLSYTISNVMLRVCGKCIPVNQVHFEEIFLCQVPVIIIHLTTTEKTTPIVYDLRISWTFVAKVLVTATSTNSNSRICFKISMFLRDFAVSGCAMHSTRTFRKMISICVFMS